jgi:DNA-binding response OmpR family regulator
MVLSLQGWQNVQGTVLLVETDAVQALEVRNALLEDDYAVQVADTFQSAWQAVAGGGVAVLITAVRLGAFNGLHLVIRTRALYPHVRFIVVGLPGDRSRDIDALNVPFFEKPVSPSTIADAVSQELHQATAQPQRRWPRKPVHLPAVVSDAAIDIIDLSYGGLRLQSSKTPVTVGSELTVNVPSLGVSVTAVARWIKPVSAAGVSWCGAEIIDPPAGSINNWRGVVDSLS